MSGVKVIRVDGEVLASFFTDGRRDIEMFNGLPEGYELFLVREVKSTPKIWELYFSPIQPHLNSSLEEITPMMVCHARGD